MALKRIRYVGPHPEVEIEWPLPGGRTIVKKNGHVDLPTKLAASYCDQEDNWRVDEPEPDRRVHIQADKKDEPAEPATKKGEG